VPKECQFRIRNNGTPEPGEAPCERPATMLFDYGDIQRWMCEWHYDSMMEWLRETAEKDWGKFSRQLLRLNR